MNTRFKNANEAYEFLLDQTIRYGEDFDNTKTLFNCGFYIMNPQQNHITNKQRNWSLKYAEAEWQWYLSGDPNIIKLGQLYFKIPRLSQSTADSN